MVDIYNSSLGQRTYSCGKNLEYFAKREMPIAVQIVTKELTVEQMKALNRLEVPGIGEFENHSVGYLSVEYRR